MSLFSKLFGGGKSEAPKAAQAEEYKDFRIFAEPIAEGGQYRIAARIEKDVNDAVKVHNLVRADTLADLDVAKTASTNKAKQLIDEQGDRLFD